MKSPMGADPEIARAGLDDSEEILALQKLAYQSEALIYDDWSIPPMTQTPEEIRSEFSCRIFLKAILDRVIVGSVRTHLVGDTCSVGRLIVHPDFQRRGIGRLLMGEAERCFPEASRFELFTGDRSAGNIRLYTRLGYRVSRRETLSPQVTLVFMEKTRLE